MAQDIDQRMVLDAYEKIHEHGEAKQGKHVLNDITASTDHDGYRVYLEGCNVKLTVNFHSSYNLDYKTEHDLDRFLRRLEDISKDYHKPGRNE
ncbi:hypothetical protein IDSA_09090 [Pseudidiomarina salinarum]|uniref:DUF3081 domain-containing protein n=1 Tax=Pseudidiomarina salinarum TaxID=435908 RepID=A0A094IXW6_9GAMM|nr:DUF3081 family protein [Pseudidiomarina salinarum]KFZ30669.1 hypothetical protein IDSA_09090 [Pseudidiomarina salinarum]RUO69187.1 DUF3081 domain-containing protein [Pseudidiomarina salinarum]